jgi:hypothetical protein
MAIPVVIAIAIARGEIPVAALSMIAAIKVPSGPFVLGAAAGPVATAAPGQLAGGAAAVTTASERGSSTAVAAATASECGSTTAVAATTTAHMATAAAGTAVASATTTAPATATAPTAALAGEVDEVRAGIGRGIEV